MDWDDDGFMYRGERYRRKYIDRVQELYRSAEDANNAIGDSEPHVHYPCAKSPVKRKSGGKDDV